MKKYLVIPPILGAIIAMGGCARHQQAQYFAATDPDTGATNYYKLTISGRAGNQKYNYQAGYFSAAAVDVLRGSMPKIPILDLPVEQLEVFDRLTEQFYGALVQEAKCLYDVSDPEAQVLAALGIRNRAALRKGTITADVNRAETQSDEAASRFEAAEKRLADADNAADQARQALNAAEDARRPLEDAQRRRDDAMQATGPSLDKKQTTEKNVEKRTLVWKKLDEAAKHAETKAAAPDATTEQKQAAEQARQTATVAKTELETAQQDLETTTKDWQDSVAASDAMKSEWEKASNDPALATARSNAAAAERDKTTAENAAARAYDDLSQAQVKALDAKHSFDLVKAEQDRVIARLDWVERRLAGVESAAGGDTVLVGAPVSKADRPNFLDEKEETIKQLTRLIWLGTLSQSDLASIGMTQNTNVYEFRKLVLWSTATNLDLSEYAAEIDSVLANVVSIAETAKTRADTRKKERAGRSKAIDQVLQRLPMLDPTQRTMLKGLFDLAAPNTDAPASPEAN